MSNFQKHGPEPAWIRLLFCGSVFGCWVILAATVCVVALGKHGPFHTFVAACYIPVFVLALYFLVSAIKIGPPTGRKLSFRIWLLTSLGLLPWIVRPFLT
jgi:hypothetical protein